MSKAVLVPDTPAASLLTLGLMYQSFTEVNVFVGKTQQKIANKIYKVLFSLVFFILLHKFRSKSPLGGVWSDPAPPIWVELIRVNPVGVDCFNL